MIENFSSSFCYVSDVVDAAMKIMETDLPGPYNIGSDIDIKISTVAEKIIKLTGSSSKITYADQTFFMSELPLPDISRATADLGWMPVVILDKGLEKTIDELRASKGLKEIGE